MEFLSPLVARLVADEVLMKATIAKEKYRHLIAVLLRESPRRVGPIWPDDILVNHSILAIVAAACLVLVAETVSLVCSLEVPWLPAFWGA